VPATQQQRKLAELVDLHAICADIKEAEATISKRSAKQEGESSPPAA